MKWVFPPNNGGEIAGFNNPSIDTFNGRKLFSVVRETIQNSMDARLNVKKPVLVSFSLGEVDRDEASGIIELVPFLEAAKATAKSQHSDTHPSFRFYERAINAIKATKKIPIFTISDFNTSGLAGDYDDSHESFKGGQWYALVKGSGYSLKANDAALGSFGHGSKAPFAVSSLRTVFYYSQIQVKGITQERFQGKSILQSMRSNYGGMTQGTGYLSSSEKCDPVLNKEIPSWVKNIRSTSGAGTGTSIMVPFPDLGFNVKNFWQEMQISILHNFYLAIKNQNLEIDFNGQQFLNSQNLVGEFSKLIEQLLKEDPENQDGRMSELESAKTIEFPTPEKTGILVSKPFGRVRWFMRTGEEIGWRGVGIARQNGMLITEEPPRLRSFPGTKPFDLILCVEGENGSKILRSIEDPSHTKFEFDRISDLEERNEAEKAYAVFAKEVRELIKENASMDTSEEIFIDDLNDFFSGAENPTIDLGKAEISNKLTLEPIRKARAQRPSNRGFDSGEGALDEQSPSEATGDGRSKKAGGTAAISLTGNSSNTGKLYEIPLEDARIVQVPGKLTKVYFSIDHKGSFLLSIAKLGESESELLKFRTENDSEWKSKRILESEKENARIKIEVELEPGSDRYALQLMANYV